MYGRATPSEEAEARGRRGAAPVFVKSSRCESGGFRHVERFFRCRKRTFSRTKNAFNNENDGSSAQRRAPVTMLRVATIAALGVATANAATIIETYPLTADCQVRSRRLPRPILVRDLS